MPPEKQQYNQIKNGQPERGASSLVNARTGGRQPDWPFTKTPRAVSQKKDKKRPGANQWNVGAGMNSTQLNTPDRTPLEQ